MRHPPHPRWAAASTATLGLLSLLTGRLPAQIPASDTIALRAIHAAIRRSSPELAALRTALEAARARVAAAGFAPALVLGVEAEEVPGGLDLSEAGSIRLDLSKEFLGGGRRRAARSLAQADVVIEAAALDAAERKVLALADRAISRSALWTAVGRRLAAEDSLLASAEESLRAWFSVGEARYVDVLRLRTERLRVQSEGVIALTEAHAARRALGALVSASDSVAIALLDSLPGRVPLTATPLPDAPDLDSLLSLSAVDRLSAARVDRAQAARAFIAAERRARLVGFAGVQRFKQETEDHTVGPTFGASVSLPFTAGRANALALASADREIAAATAAREAALTTVRADLLAARDRYEAARARLAVFDAALLRAAREEREGALASYRGGDLSLIELLDFERALARADIERLRSLVDAVDALADLLTGAFAAIDDRRSTTGSTSRGRLEAREP